MVYLYFLIACGSFQNDGCVRGFECEVLIVMSISGLCEVAKSGLERKLCDVL